MKKHTVGVRNYFAIVVIFNNINKKCVEFKSMSVLNMNIIHCNKVEEMLYIHTSIR